MTHFDTIIIGAGPAGLSAADILCESQKVLIVDEYYYPGGRLLGQLYEDGKNHWWNGIDVAKNLYAAIEDKVDVSLETSVFNTEKSDGIFNIYTSKGHFTSDYLIAATGAKEKSVPLPGWELPGVMTVGAAQVLTNFQRVKPGNKGIIIGINPLSMVIAMELGYADIHVEKICLPPNHFIHHTTPKDALETLVGLGTAAPSRLLSFGASAAGKMKIFHNAALHMFPRTGIRALGLPVSIKERVVRINGTDSVASVTLQKTDSAGVLIEGTEQEIECDFVCLSDGLSPLNEITSLFNLKHVYIESLGGYVPLHSAGMRTEIDGLYVAGNITGIENAKIAMLQGQIAAADIIKDAGFYKKLDQLIQYERKHAKVKFHKDLNAGRQFIQTLWDEHQKSKAQ